MTELNRNENTCRYDFGSFEGFNFRSQSAIPKTLSIGEVLNWDHDQNGEAEFWPSGDCEGVSLVFKNLNAVTSSELMALEELLTELGGDSDDNYVKVYYSVSVLRERVDDIESSKIEDQTPLLFWGDYISDIRKEAAYELFELYFPELFKVWESTPCDGLYFDTDLFLDSPQWSTDEVKINGRAALLVSPQ